MSEDHGVALIVGKTEKLRELSARLVKLDPGGSETRAAVAITLFLNDWKWTEAENEFKQALQLDPTCRMALTYYGYFLTDCGATRMPVTCLNARASSIQPRP